MTQLWTRTLEDALPVLLKFLTIYSYRQLQNNTETKLIRKNNYELIFVYMYRILVTMIICVSYWTD